jgi:hypothetical protein
MQTRHIIASQFKRRLKLCDEFSSGSMARQPKGNLSDEAAGLLFIGNSQAGE